MEDTSYNKFLLNTAIALAYKAGAVLRRSFFTDNFEVRFKEDGTKVTSVDIEVEKMIKDEITKTFPSHKFFGEESEKEEGENTWYVDPIDGTSNFIKKVPFFTTSIGFESPNHSFGVVYSPITDELFYSFENSYLNGNLISDVEGEKDESKLQIGFCHSKDRKILEDVIKFYSVFKKRFGETRKFGATSLEMCYVACSRLDAFVGINISLWDFKASYHICKKAGLVVKELEFNNLSVLMCSKRSYVDLIEGALEEIFNN